MQQRKHFCPGEKRESLRIPFPLRKLSEDSKAHGGPRLPTLLPVRILGRGTNVLRILDMLIFQGRGNTLSCLEFKMKGQ